MELPNIKSTWESLGIEMEPYEDWLERTQNKGSRDTLLSMYLDELWMKYRPETFRKLGGLGGLDAAQEVAYAYFALIVGQDSDPAERFIRGERLHPGLHPEYVAQTKCYG